MWRPLIYGASTLALKPIHYGGQESLSLETRHPRRLAGERSHPVGTGRRETSTRLCDLSSWSTHLPRALLDAGPIRVVYMLTDSGSYSPGNMY